MYNNNNRRGNKRMREQNANVEKSASEQKENERKFLKAPKPGVNQANTLLMYNNHMNWLELKIKKELRDISCLVRGQEPQDILNPVAVGTPSPQEAYQPPQTPTATPAVAIAAPVGPADPQRVKHQLFS